MCSPINRPKPDKFVEIFGTPITVHSAKVLGKVFSTSKCSTTLMYKDMKLTRCVSPGFIIGREDTQMTTTYEFFVINGK